jgi:2-polyprenyl-3-methyl-5-hydroxy-6-metoxy-1,4-benzoquinol methylase
LNLEQSIIEEVITDVREHLDKNFAPKRALDFGCGVGRLLIPLSKLCEEVVGIDVSDSMLAKADEEFKKRDIHNFQLIKSDDDLSLLNGKFDFIHSYIVLQHIPVKRGEKILVRLLDCLEEDGVGVLHFLYYDKNPLLAKISKAIKTNIPFSYMLKRILKKESLSAPPPVEINCYDLNRLFLFLQNKGFNKIYSSLRQGNNICEAVLFFKK